MTEPARKPDGVGRLLFVAVTCLLLGSVVASFFQGEHAMDGKPVVPFSLPVVAGPSSERGTVIDTQALRGKVYLLDFWATWCGPCRQSIPVLTRIAHRYREQGVRVIGVDTESNLDPSRLAEAFRVLGGEFVSVQDTSGSLMRAFGVQGLPTLFLVDQTGTVRYVHVGAADESALDREISRLIK